MRTSATTVFVWSILLMMEVVSMISAKDVKADVCSDALSSLRPCLASVIGSHPPEPTEDCCKKVKAIPPQTACKCFANAGNSKGGSGINQDAAKKIPQKCGVSVPPHFKC